MAQESTAIQTNNSGGLLAGLGNLVNSLATPAANLYTLKLQGDVLKQQAAGSVAAAQAQAAGASAQQTQSQLTAAQTRWLVWGGIALAVVVVLALVLRRRK